MEHHVDRTQTEAKPPTVAEASSAPIQDTPVETADPDSVDESLECEGYGFGV